MARTNLPDPAKAPTTADTETTVVAAFSPAGVAGTSDGSAANGAQAGATQSADPDTIKAEQSALDTANAAVQENTEGTVTVSVDAKPVFGEQVHADDDADDKGEITIYPLRSYLDGKEIRCAGGKGYKSPKHDAVSLIAAGLATDKKPKV